jgi:integrase
MDLVPAAQTAPGRTPDASIAQLVAIAAAMPRKTGANVISLLVTGLRVEEFHKLDPETDVLPNQQALRIGRIEATEGTAPFTLSTKNTSSAGLRYVPEGFWPIVAWSARNKPAYVTLRRHWCQACHEVGLGTVTRTDGKEENGVVRFPTKRWPQKFTYKGLRLHDLRHFYTQYVRDGGVPLSELRHALGHASEESSAGYAARLGRVPETAADKARRAKRLAADVAGKQFADLLSIESLWPVEQDGDE